MLRRPAVTHAPPATLGKRIGVRRRAPACAEHDGRLSPRTRRNEAPAAQADISASLTPEAAELIATRDRFVLKMLAQLGMDYAAPGLDPSKEKAPQSLAGPLPVSI